MTNGAAFVCPLGAKRERDWETRWWKFFELVVVWCLTLRARPPFTGRKVPQRSAFWVILGTWLGVPHGVLFECFWHFLSAKSAKKRSKSTPWGTPSHFRPGPLSTPVNGGRDRKSNQRMPSISNTGDHLRPSLAAQTTHTAGSKEEPTAYRRLEHWQLPWPLNHRKALRQSTLRQHTSCSGYPWQTWMGLH